MIPKCPWIKQKYQIFPSTNAISSSFLLMPPMSFILSFMNEKPVQITVVCNCASTGSNTRCKLFNSLGTTAAFPSIVEELEVPVFHRPANIFSPRLSPARRVSSLEHCAQQ